MQKRKKIVKISSLEVLEFQKAGKLYEVYPPSGIYPTDFP